METLAKENQKTIDEVKSLDNTFFDIENMKKSANELFKKGISLLLPNIKN